MLRKYYSSEEFTRIALNEHQIIKKPDDKIEKEFRLDMENDMCCTLPKISPPRIIDLVRSKQSRIYF